MIDVKVLKEFAGLEVGRLTQLTEEQYAKLHEGGFVELEDASKNVSNEKSSKPKGK